LRKRYKKGRVREIERRVNLHNIARVAKPLETSNCEYPAPTSCGTRYQNRGLHLPTSPNTSKQKTKHKLLHPKMNSDDRRHRLSSAHLHKNLSERCSFRNVWPSQSFPTRKTCFQSGPLNLRGIQFLTMHEGLRES
jgi:hypothetical protein